MLKAEKVAEVEQIADRLGKAKAAIVTEYRGLTVEQLTTLRAKIGEAEGGYRVMKNRLAKRALAVSPLEGIEVHLAGPNALATANADPVPLAKVLVDFAKENEALKIKGGNVEGKIVDLDQIRALAKLPSREILLSQLLSVLNAPARDMASVLAAVPRSLATVIKAIGDTKSA